MKLSEINERDGLMAAHLLQFLAMSNKLVDALKLAGLPISGPGVDKREETNKWFTALASEMAKQIKAGGSKPAEDTGFRVKSVGMGPSPASASTKPKAKAKKSKK